ncbi:hypothetical protein ABT369_50480 [Dactylosporangium sp. NPDC000244]|uniref:hypothetical protein n=1 Tax=Dactylosporangium sp. NPDC000244 TaxID=3154365 RepID=UPI003317012E
MEEQQRRARRGLTRRRVVGYGLQAGALAALAGAGLDGDGTAPLVKTSADPGAPSFSRVLRRREDQLNLRFDTYNLTLSRPASGPVLLRIDPAAPAYVVVVFPPQHLQEQAFREPDPTGAGAADAPAWPVATRLSAASRLAFEVPPTMAAIPFDDTTMLTWGQFALKVAPAALPRDTPAGGPLPITAPGLQETAIEVPWRLLLSPHAQAGWAHATQPAEHGGRTELWHTRLGVAKADGTVDEQGGERTVRALWATDPDFPAWLLPAGSPGAKSAPDGATIPAPGLPFRASLTPRDRLQIVRATADYAIAGYTPQPIDVRRLVLTPQGASADLQGSWNPPANVLSILDWKHRTTLGRDMNVRVVSRGYLLPFGHQAALVTVTERRIAGTPGGKRAAYLRQRSFLVVRRRSQAFAGFAQADGGRGLPFQRIDLLTSITPDLDPATAFVPALGGAAFLPKVGGAPYQFSFTGIDHVGRAVDFTAPAVFVDSTIAFAEASAGQVRAAYNALAASDPIRRRPLNGQTMGLAPSAEPGDTDVQAVALTFAAQAPVAGPADAQFLAHDQPRCHPVLSGATIRLAAAEHLGGADLGPVDLEVDQRYLKYGFGAQNAGQVFAALVKPVGFGIGSDRGGPLTPGLSITMLSRLFGPAGGDPATLAGGTVDTPAILAAAPNDPQILGGIKLSDVVQPVSVTDGATGTGAMALRSSDGFGPVPIDGPHNSEAQTFSLRPKLREGDPLGILKFTDTTYCEIDITVASDPANPAEKHFTFKALLLNREPWNLVKDLPDGDQTQPQPALDNKPAFTLRLLGDIENFLEIDFQRFVFQAETGKDTVVDPSIGDVRFKGVLQYIQKLADKMKSVTPAGQPKPGVLVHKLDDRIEVGLKATLPPLTVGVFTLKNIMFGMGVVLPLMAVGNQNGPRPVRFLFHFAERENPFLLSVYCFGGGGYLTMGVGTDGMEFFEVALEFGAHLEADFGVASGNIEAMAGIYLRLDIDPHGKQALQLTGYVRMHGGLTAFAGIVSLSIEMYLGLTYQSQGNKMIGQATLTVEVQVGFFNASVSLHAEKKFRGDEADPTFLDQMPAQSYWDDYASAFAPIGA